MSEQQERDEERDALAFRLFLIESGQDEVFLARVWDNHGDGHPVKAGYLRQADALIAAGYRKHPEPEITDQTVERFKIAWFSYRVDRGIGAFERRARAALEAALRVAVGEGE